MNAIFGAITVHKDVRFPDHRSIHLLVMCNSFSMYIMPISEYSPYETYSSSDIRNLFSPQSGSEDVNIYDVNKDDEYLPIDKR
ncbi:hypothetical protein MAR_033349 [Mya arenaria]|uniref:Uncharacterized protein n=1 Tax=Mya arenaria TaxID=6604 RepID=A0ABY7GBT1_MYAAR|nr:hypothetical protein MAR_033349 [Mya arenaria]